MKASILVVDPPWLYYGDPDKDGAAGKHFPGLSFEQLAAIPVKEAMESKAALFLWATGPKMHEATELIRQWGLHYRNVAYVWVKVNAEGDIIYGQGPPATYTKQNAEYLLFATTTPRGRPFPILDHAHPQIVLAKKREHSAKPRRIHRLIESMTDPSLVRLELFARRRREGWVTLGMELDGLDINASLRRFIEEK